MSRERQAGARGPLDGVRVVEFAGFGPVPFAAMLLADMGADIVRVARPGEGAVLGSIDRGRRIVELDMSEEAARASAFDLAVRSDIVFEGFRPGVLERMGLAPERLHASNPALVVGRMSAWGQEGPQAKVPGHDINILALSGLLSTIGPAERPAIPLNLVADYGGGALYLVMGTLAALLSARATGIGRTVDCAMYDATASLMSLQVEMWQTGRATLERETNLLDGGAPFYAVYPCADGGFLAVGAIEPKFYANLLDVLGLAGTIAAADQYVRATWPKTRAKLAELFGSRSRAAWEAAFDGIETCVSPVLDIDQASGSVHARSRGTFVEIAGRLTPAPAPRFGGTPRPSDPSRATDVADIVASWVSSDYSRPARNVVT